MNSLFTTLGFLIVTFHGGRLGWTCPPPQLLAQSAVPMLESWWGSGRARSARRQLRAAEAPAALSVLLSDCEAPLDRIAHAPEQAAADLTAYRDEDQRLGAQLESLTAAALAVAPYRPDRSAAASLVEQAQGLLPSDPLATLRCLSEARENQVNAGLSSIIKPLPKPRRSRMCLQDGHALAAMEEDV